VKYGLLRALADGRRLGVAWYLFPDEDHNADGCHTAYLRNPDCWRAYDSALFDSLKWIVKGGKRKVSAIEKLGILKDARFSIEVLSTPELTPAQRRVWRSRWFENVQAALCECDVVFADPNNGLCEDEKFGAGRVKDWKRIPLSEARALAQGRTAVIYHHNTRRKGGHAKEIAYWKNRLGADTIALRWLAYSPRTFFVINPAPDMHERLTKFAQKWGPKAELD